MKLMLRPGTSLMLIRTSFHLKQQSQVSCNISWYSNVSTYSSLDGQLEVGPSYVYEYNTRQAYGGNISWPDNAPLNATWWHLVSQDMENDGGALVELYNAHQGKMSTLSPNCTSAECIEAKVCYLRVSPCLGCRYMRCWS